MEQLKPIVAANLAQLRQKKGMTQMELAERLNYSDKAVSKWERGESIPDVGVLYSIAELFGVTVDYLLHAEHAPEEERNAASEKRNHVFITCLGILLVWLVATLVFAMIDIFAPVLKYHYLAFIYAVPVSAIVWLVFNCMWFRLKWNYLIISILMWSLLTAVFLTILPFGAHPWQLFLLGIPGQAIIVIWSRLKFHRKKKTE